MLYGRKRGLWRTTWYAEVVVALNRKRDIEENRTSMVWKAGDAFPFGIASAAFGFLAAHSYSAASELHIMGVWSLPVWWPLAFFASIQLSACIWVLGAASRARRAQ